MHYIKLFSGHYSHTNAYGVEVRNGNDAPASLGRNGWYAAIENYKNDGHLAITYVGDGDRDTARALVDAAGNEPLTPSRFQELIKSRPVRVGQ